MVDNTHGRIVAWLHAGAGLKFEVLELRSDRCNSQQTETGTSVPHPKLVLTAISSLSRLKRCSVNSSPAFHMWRRRTHGLTGLSSLYCGWTLVRDQ